MKERNFEFKDLESIHNAIESLKKDIPQCYILLYNRNNDECRLEKLSWKELDSTFEKIDGLNRMLRGK